MMCIPPAECSPLDVVKRSFFIVEPSKCPCYLPDGFVRMACFSDIERSFDRMLWVHRNSFQMQMPHLESSPDLFTCLMYEKVTKL